MDFPFSSRDSRQINGRVMSWKTLKNTITHVRHYIPDFQQGMPNAIEQIVRTVHMHCKQSRRCGRSAAGMNVDGVKVKKKKYITIIYSQAHKLEKTSKKKIYVLGRLKFMLSSTYSMTSLYSDSMRNSLMYIIILDVTEVVTHEK